MNSAEDRLKSLGSYMKENGVDLYYSPYYTYVLAEPDSYNARHSRCVLRIKADQLLEGNYVKIRKLFEDNAEYICGFRPSLRSDDTIEFVAEMLFGDFVPCAPIVGYNEDASDREIIHSGRFRHFNASMVYDIIVSIKYDFDEDFESVDVQNLMGACCFLSNIRDCWETDTDVSNIIDNLYWEDCLKRDD